jgi:hypothetical protein
VQVREIAGTTAEWALITASRGISGWIKVRNLHVQLSDPRGWSHAAATKRLATGSHFNLTSGRQCVVVNTRYASGSTGLRLNPNSAKGENLVPHGTLANHTNVTVAEAAASNSGYEWFMVKVKVAGRDMQGWIRGRNLHVQV